MTGIEHRLACLERTGRLQRAGLVVLGLTLGVVLLAGAGSPMPDVIRAEGFEVVDGDGRVLVTIGSDEDGGLVTLRNRQEAVYMILTTDRDGGLFVIRNRNDQPVVSAYADDDGGAMLLKNSLGGDIVLLAADSTGRGLMNLRDHAQKATVVLGSDPDGGFFELRNGVESPALFAGVIENGTGTIFTLDTEGNRTWTSPSQ
jgi:hypothetical protein